MRVKFHDALLRRAQNLEVEAMRLCTVVYGHGRTAPGLRRRVGLPTCAAWDELGVGDMVSCEDAVCVIVWRDAESARVSGAEYAALRLHDDCFGVRVQWQRHARHGARRSPFHRSASTPQRALAEEWST